MHISCSASYIGNRNASDGVIDIIGLAAWKVTVSVISICFQNIICYGFISNLLLKMTIYFRIGNIVCVTKIISNQ